MKDHAVRAVPSDNAGACAKKTLLVVDDEPNMAWLFQESFSGQFEIRAARDGVEALAALDSGPVHLVMQDLQIPGSNGLQIMREIKKRFPDLPVIMMTAYATVKTAVEAMRAGAYDYVIKPFDLDELRLTIGKALEFANLRQEVEGLRRELKETRGEPELQAVSPKMREVIRVIEKVAQTDTYVLIQGESGTGKELAARAIHRRSPRSQGPFIPVNCAALPETLLESELFGHEKGAFTGAQARRPGRFELAHRGTLFLDEVGDMPLILQSKLLRVLEEKTVEPLGSTRRIAVDVRVVAATNQNLRELVKNGSFREDLFFRLAVIPITLPPLRERTEDIPLLAGYFLKMFSARHGKCFRGFSPEALDMLTAYPWPGNVRELKNTIEQVAVLFDDQLVLPEHLPGHLTPSAGDASNPGDGGGTLVVEGPPLKEQVGSLKNRLEEERIRAALAKFNGNRTRAAEYLGISRRSLQLKIKALAIKDV